MATHVVFLVRRISATVAEYLRFDRRSLPEFPASMPFVIINGERLALEQGETVLGGHGERALETEALAHLEPFAVLNHPLDGPGTIRALDDHDVTLNGMPIGPEPDVLRHLDRIEASGIVLVYGESRRVARESRAGHGRTEQTAIVPIVPSHGEPTASTGGRLTRLQDRSVHPIVDGGLTLGRDAASGIVLTAKDVSKKHATISPSLLGYTLTDHSYRGVWVNGSRVDRSCVLGQRDVIRINDDEFRFEADPTSFEPDIRREEDASIAAGVSLDKSHEVVASIEVVSNGPLKGTRFRLARPTAQIGRSRYNDVRLIDESVSARHASLVRRGNRWIIFDVDSANGTYVEGQRVRDQRVLPDHCELQLGVVRLLFRAFQPGGQPGATSKAALHF
jgi:pSer/pThr/pTyr-binding forkhead associated (FHA) protein